ncbi:MAG: hypothetical protein Q9162_006719 [Coniocarpon cinnabarinum]
MWSVLLGALATLSTVASAIPTISAKGQKFFDSNGAQFFIKGVAYQLTESDPLLDNDQCRADAKLMSDLGANAIRVYHVDDGDHSGCMQTFSDAGIYVFLDLDTFNTYILEDDAFWNQTQLQAYSAVMDEFQAFDNLAGFFIGNEVIQMGNYSTAAVYIKSATRDLKAYRDSKGYRDIPIGYSHADISSLRPNLQNYLSCGTNNSVNIDFFGLNAYEWCGDNDFQGSGYATLQQQAMDYPVPIFLSETGCNKPEPRTFQDQTAVFGPDMDQTWSGAIIYEWIQEANGYGLVAYDSALTAGTATIPGTASIPRSGTPLPVSPDYSNLKKVWASVTPSSVSANAYNPSMTNPPCPAYTSGVWEINGDASLPALGETLNPQQSASVTAGGSGPAPTASATQSGIASPGKVLVLYRIKLSAD